MIKCKFCLDSIQHNVKTSYICALGFFLLFTDNHTVDTGSLDKIPILTRGC